MLRSDSFEQRRRRFVAGVLGDEFAGKGPGEDRGRELADLPTRHGQPQLKLVCQSHITQMQNP